MCILRANVMKSQSVRDKPYDAWATVWKKDGFINDASCTCMAE